MGFVWILFGLSMRMILPFLQICGMLLCTLVGLKMTEGPYFYRPKGFQVPIGYVIEAVGPVDLVLSIVALVMLVFRVAWGS